MYKLIHLSEYLKIPPKESFDSTLLHPVSSQEILYHSMLCRAFVFVSTATILE